MEAQGNKPHRKPHSGRKSERKKSKKSANFESLPKSSEENKNKTKRNLDDPNEANEVAKRRNPKAFSFKSAVKASKAVHRAADLVEKKTHVPLVDRSPVEPPPIIVALVGPAKVGKTTLLRCLVKHYTRQNLTAIHGPITVVSGKKRRITFIECNNDISSMIDIAKIADLVLLLVDASYGFEMDTFEFLNICQVHGMPRVLGVMTHLDMIKSGKRLKNRKKLMKHRFWTEVYQGAKLFYLSALKSERYLQNEVKNLARFISVMKFRPLLWKTTHPYILADRMEDMTEPESIRSNPKCDRNVCVYGYVRGTHLRNKSLVHIPGVGDIGIQEVSRLPDPCGLPEESKKRSLNEKERSIYAPFSGLGGIVYDKDAVYIDAGGSQFAQKSSGPEADIVKELAEGDETIDAKLAQSEMAIFSGDKPLISADTNSVFADPDETPVSNMEYDGASSDSEDEDMDESMEGSSDDEDKAEFRRKSNGSHGFDVENSSWTDKLAYKADSLFRKTTSRRKNWAKIVYAAVPGPSAEIEEEDEVGGLFTVTNSKKTTIGNKVLDSAAYTPLQNGREQVTIRNWSTPESQSLLRNYFAKGMEAGSDSENENDYGEEDGMDSDDDLDGDFEDFEENATKKEPGEESKMEVSDDDNEEEDDEDDGDEANPKRKLRDGEDADARSRREMKKKKLKQMFDAEYDETSRFYNDLKEELDEQSKLNKAEFDTVDEELRVQYEGFRPGMYVRIELEPVSSEFVDNFDPDFPYILGGLLSGEQNIGCVQVRIKKHRWFKRVMKTRDPLIMSMGWRRFQSMVIYHAQDHNGRNRLLKYTPEFMHCHAVFWGPITPQNTGFLAVQTLAKDSTDFRIAATGVVLNTDKSLQITKKLKLTGFPYKIFKKTAFIKGMFNSSLEVAKFEGASLKTVSGVRGQIKKTVNEQPGAFRATFEDKILLKDIVFLRTWYRVDVPDFYTTVTNLMREGEGKKTWEGMKTVGQLRYERNLKPPTNQDSLYKPVFRRPFVPDELRVPASLQAALPYAYKPKEAEDAGPPKSKKNKLEEKHTAIVLEPHESKIMELMKVLKAVDSDKKDKDQLAMEIRVGRHKEEMAAKEGDKERKMKETKKRICKVLSQRERKQLSAALKIQSKGKGRRK